LREEVDTLITIPNDRLLSISDRHVSVLDAFRSADQVLLSGVQGITDLITTPGLINLDFADVKSVMQGAGSALMGIGSARGEDRAIQAAETAISSPLLEASVDGAHGVLLSIQGGSDLGLFEINEAARLVQEAAHPEANIIFGAVIDDALGDEVRVTVIAAGFDGGSPTRRRDERALGQVSGRAIAPPTSSSGSSGSAPVAQPAPALPTVPQQPVPANAHAGHSSYPISTPGGGYPQANPNGSNGFNSQPAPLSPPTGPVTSPPPRPLSEPDRQWTSHASSEPDRSTDSYDDQPPRVLEVPETTRPPRTPRPIVLEDDDLDVPDFLK
jgi:cell division protein FtsZ